MYTPQSNGTAKNSRKYEDTLLKANNVGTFGVVMPRPVLSWFCRYHPAVSTQYKSDPFVKLVAVQSLSTLQTWKSEYSMVLQYPVQRVKDWFPVD